MTPFCSTQIDRMAEDFKAAKPFPSIVIDGFLNTSPALIQRVFPDEYWDKWSRWADEYQTGKRFCGNIEFMPDLLQQIIREMCESRFLSFLESVTGIPKLISDPHLSGGGLHSSGTGGVLMPHTDFHTYERLRLYRRVNAILYLNDGWNKEWGGNLGLYNKRSRKPEKEIEPAFGRLVVFRTDHQSIHGFAQPIAEGHRRDSIALYYYTADDAPSFDGDTTTYWRQHAPTTRRGSLRLWMYKCLIRASSMLARTAHRWNPHLDRYHQPKPPEPSSPADDIAAT